MAYFFTSESVSEGHPDKVADQISDALLDEFLRQDPDSKVACETLVTTGLTVLSGEVKTSAYVDVQSVARRVINQIGYNQADYKFDSESCGVISAIHEQSADINRGVERDMEEEQGAGDQGMMFGYATRETDNYMPLPLELAHTILVELANIRKEGRRMRYLRPDAKSQVTVEYSDKGKPVRIDTIVISTQHDEFYLPDDATAAEQKKVDKDMQERIQQDVEQILLPRVRKNLPRRLKRYFADEDYKLFVNPTGKFVIGGPHGDTGLTGRKIIVDTYGGRGAHGGGAFSGKDPSKVDRSAAYAMRHIAKNLVAAGVADEILAQVAYAIGVAQPVGVYINTFGTCRVRKKDGSKYSDAELGEKVLGIFDLRPSAIIKRLQLKNPIYLPTAAYGHMGRYSYSEEVTLIRDGKNVKKKVEFFTWEKLDYIDEIRKKFNM